MNHRAKKKIIFKKSIVAKPAEQPESTNKKRSLMSCSQAVNSGFATITDFEPDWNIFENLFWIKTEAT